ncbi:MAG: PqiC family protein [Syntrophobacteraceae bacterium]|nr:PqiC family protein [Syntrophobacteraceae bacterium]
MSPRSGAISILLLISCFGCSSALVTGTPPVYFELSHGEFGGVCPDHRQGSVRVWPFSASAPYDREEMIILEPSRRVRFSPHFRWITSPGSLIADALTRDLSADGPFERVLTASSPGASNAQMSGHVYRFAWVDQGEGRQQAQLEVQISLWQEEPRQAVLLNRRYRLESRPLATGSPEMLAAIMSELTAEFSARLREDLCAMASGSSSRPSD